MKTENVRVRFAPSPTGNPHVGNIRTALFNWLFARHNNGEFVLRIEDTDRERYQAKSTEAILESLAWMGLDYDEGPAVGGPYGPYVQSERLGIYNSAVVRLLDTGSAYRCYCSKEDLDTRRRIGGHSSAIGGYDRRCRNLTTEEHLKFEGQGGVPSVVRFAVPLEGETTINDLIHRRVAWKNILLDDFIIMKSDGFPTYHLANVVDDNMMKITHVLRADEWLSSTPRHVLLYQALGYDPPFFAHLPMILGPDKAKLSKRHGANSILEYKNAGYLPEAMANFLVLLGWSLDDKTDVLSIETVIKAFSLERIGKAAAVFDHSKLEWINGVYIRQMSDKQFSDHMIPFLSSQIRSKPGIEDYIQLISPLIRERAKTLKDTRNLTEYFFDDPTDGSIENLLQKGMDERATLKMLEAIVHRIDCLNFYSRDSVQSGLESLVEQLQVSRGQLLGTLRSSITGKQFSPPISDVMAILGKENCLRRIQNSIRILHSSSRNESD